jgi:YegS/Rv2252/BmrU family lipid kinase
MVMPAARTSQAAGDRVSGPAVFIVNPRSSGGRTAKRWPALQAALKRAGVECEARFTTAPGEATLLARAALREGAARVIAVGGDGTLNEVVNGCFDEAGTPVVPQPVVGLLPSGTGGDFRRSLRIPTDADQCAALLAGGSVRSVDAGRVDYEAAGEPPRYFINIADCGVGGEVVARVNRTRHVGGGTVTFLYHSLAALLTYRAQPVRVDVDGESLAGTAQNVVIANGRYFGGGMKVAPDAEVDDGLFDVVLIGGESRLRTLAGVRRIYDGSHVRQPMVTCRRGRVVTVTPLGDEPLLFDVEGEQVGRAPATLTCLPSALRFCAPG